MPTLTSNYDLLKPLVNNATDESLWGGQLNSDLDSIDTLLRAGITTAIQTTQTIGFTADASISVKKLYPCDATASGFTATIPSAATAGNGATIYVKKIDSTSHAITLARTGSDTLDNATSLSLASENAVYGLVSDGVSKWESVSASLSTSIFAPINSPVFTGDPQAPTPLAGDNDTSIATTAFVNTNNNIKAWVKFAGASGAISASKNVTSVTRSSAGTYVVTFTSALSSANYAVSLCSDFNHAVGFMDTAAGAPSTTTLHIGFMNLAAARGDPSNATVTVIL